MDKEFILTEEELINIFKAGFNSSSEGFNGEYRGNTKEDLLNCKHYFDNHITFKMLFEEAIKDLKEK